MPICEEKKKRRILPYLTTTQTRKHRKTKAHPLARILVGSTKWLFILRESFCPLRPFLSIGGFSLDSATRVASAAVPSPLKLHSDIVENPHTPLSPLSLPPYRHFIYYPQLTPADRNIRASFSFEVSRKSDSPEYLMREARIHCDAKPRIFSLSPFWANSACIAFFKDNRSFVGGPTNWNVFQDFQLSWRTSREFRLPVSILDAFSSGRNLPPLTPLDVFDPEVLLRGYSRSYRAIYLRSCDISTFKKTVNIL